MLLQRLTEYADRLGDVLPAEYYRPKQIHWVLDLDKDGTATLRDLRVSAKNRDQARTMPVPYAQRSGTKVPPYMLVDTAEFVLGVPKADKTNPPTDKAQEEAGRRHAAYRDLALLWAQDRKDDPGATALRSYFASGGPAGLDIPDEVQAKDTVAVMVATRWLHEEPTVKTTWASVVVERKGGADDRPGLCLVCGTTAPLLATIPEPVKKGAVPTNGGSNEGQLVSINKAAQGRDGKTQLVNTPICHRCGGRAMAVLNHLLASDNHSRRFRDDGVMVWWTRQAGDDSAMALLFGNAPDPADIAHLIDSLDNSPTPHTAQRVEDDEFHALTLGLNNARLVVRDWIDIPLTDLKATVAAWYKDHGVYDGWKGTTRYVPLWRLALCCGRAQDGRYAKDSAPHGLEAELVHSALRRTSPPARTLPLLLQRIHADQYLDTARIALLRLILNRSSEPKDHVMMTLDADCRDASYLCGRLFAVLEDIQTTALPNLNTTLREKYFRTAATAPGTTLTNLRIDANAHLKRVRRDKKGAAVALERRLGELFALFSDDMPRHLTPLQQGRFVMGYEHERAAKWDRIRRAKEKGEDSPEE
ncbi:type I-C CRISPR-associated protein Cas8c/Csd1 [Streptomyces griseolus]|uniref:type I-C CRISPR-associated protein Cas8c/Csd1 n=1 Tax=Streptomyces griseolus TaxID=1909 RepID=UPI002243051D|nr:type I-C CRISPR-associated protein Cas8c/Csd1 [Streptomyces griseolus]MCW8219876.1 type I-C CRISPR-associated protein Cas8c/Csd1 [Streptomyces griseolus]